MVRPSWSSSFSAAEKLFNAGIVCDGSGLLSSAFALFLVRCQRRDRKGERKADEENGETFFLHLFLCFLFIFSSNFNIIVFSLIFVFLVITYTYLGELSFLIQAMVIFIPIQI